MADLPEPDPALIELAKLLARTAAAKDVAERFAPKRGKTPNEQIRQAPPDVSV
ncbi:hypothetical protein [Novosphingobium nitrogenifigens]|uniref:hypothetical protein n=1 Tax=Novosphingobium nitrogenifigens TaxID=378548 RepID=UPI0012F4830E|nr:hypothetical protein [Novosphingobium nitrogenifigens]